jgi:hypothetical protein
LLPTQVKFERIDIKYMARARIGSNVEKGLKYFVYGKHGK